MLPILLAALQTVTATVHAPPRADTVLPPADSASIATAFADAGTRELVRLARRQLGVIDASVFRYSAISRQRISVGIRALRRDRLLFRRESASVLDWRRDGASRVEVVGAREVIPMAVAGVRVPEDLESWGRAFIPEPGDDRLFVNPTGSGFAWHPLVEGGESLYRYATGDTTVIGLPDGRDVRLVELRVTPRVPDIRVVAGSFWIELDHHSIVQAVFRPSRDFDFDRDHAAFDSDDDSDVPAFLKPVRLDVRYITVEYGLWEMRWWMPRLMAFEGSLQTGPLRFPVTIELTYSDYTVEGDRHGLPELPPVVLRLAGDPHGEARTHRYPIRVVVADTSQLVDSPYLPGSIFAAGDRLIPAREIRELGDRLGSLPSPPWHVERPVVTLPWQPGRGLLRYNRVEGLSAGGRMDLELGRGRLDLTGRLGSADLVPNVELGIDIPTFRHDWRVAGYHRLASADPTSHPFGIRNSLGALLFGRDDGIYYRASGAELLIDPASGAGFFRARVYAERQARADHNTDFSLRRVFNEGHRFAPNIEAHRADQVGAALGFGWDRGLDPAGSRWAAWVDARGETGTYAFLQPGVTLSGGVPLPGRLVGVVEVGAGTTFGSADAHGLIAPLQSHWFIGGPATLRGFPSGAFAGQDYGRVRVEVANRMPAARLVLFGDAGWAGTFDEFHARQAGVSAGAGASLLDGLLRVDLARSLNPTRDWRLDVYSELLF